MSDYAVHVESLSRAFRGKQALSNVTMKVPTGSVFGLVGLNGAGKTTLIRHIIGSMTPIHGSVSVLGRDPTVQPERLLGRIGYMTEEDSLPSWMRVSDMLQFCRTVYPTWSDDYAAELCEMFSLSPKASLKSLSKGGRARAALLAAIGHRPELLILDEPSSGLDPIARADILEAIIRTTVEEGRTVLFSSHLLDEIDRVCDHIALIHEGKLLETSTADELASRYSELVYRTEDPDARLPSVAGTFGAMTSHLNSTSAELSMVLDHQAVEHESAASSIEVSNGRWELMHQRPASIHRWFAGRVRQTPNEKNENLEVQPSKEPSHA